MVGHIKNEVVSTPFIEVFANKKVLDEKSLAQATVLAGGQ
jgi:hypothetical protein